MLKFVQLACLAVGLSFGVVSAQAVTPSPAMIEQFKKLPPAQQQQLAKQYGYDVSQLGLSGTAPATAEQLNMPQNLAQPVASPSPARAPARSGKSAKRFGMSLFDQTVSTFAPVDKMPVPESYTLGAGDTLLVQLFGKETAEYSLTLDREGKVLIPDLAPITLQNLNFAEAKQLISQRIAQAKIGTEAAVSMGQLRTINVFMAGEVNTPGMYAVSALTSVTQMLYAAGGVSEIGSLRNIEVKRAGKKVTHFDLYQLLIEGNNANDINLQHGDVVFVPPYQSVVALNGAVLRSGEFELIAQDTLASLLKMAGGTTVNAYLNAATLHRIDNNREQKLISLDLSQPETLNMSLQNGDNLTVNTISNRIRNQVTLAGAVVRPGKVAWQPGMTVNQLLPNLWQDIIWSADLDYAIILREANAKGDIKVIQFAPSGLFTGDANADLALQARDVVILFHQGNDSYNRDKLNDALRALMADPLSDVKANPALAGDLAGRLFNRLQRENVLVGTQQLTEQDDIETDSNALVRNQFNVMLENLYHEDRFVRLTPHLSRTELLFAVLQKLKKQSSNSQNLAVVSISGEVKVPGEYPLPENATLSKLMLAAGGAKPSAFLNRAELSRYSLQSDGSNAVDVKHQQVDVAAALTTPAADIALQSRDRVNVFSTPDWAEARKITLQGEVNFPGVYSIQKGETLSQVLARAGGVTRDAFLFGAVFTRKSVQQREATQQSRLINQLKADLAARSLTAQLGSTPPAEAINLVEQMRGVTPVGRLVINAEQILAANPQHDVSVEEGDVLVIPRQTNSISVMGEVQVPGSHRFDTGLTVKEYLTLAGGLRKRADDDRIYVIRADGSVVMPGSSWYKLNTTALRPGDTIIVPLDTEYKDSMSLWSQVTQIFYQSAVALAALNSF